MKELNTTKVVSGMTHHPSLRAVRPKRTLSMGTSTVAMVYSGRSIVARQEVSTAANGALRALAIDAGGQHVTGQLEDLLVEDPLLGVGEGGEAGVDLVELVFVEGQAQLGAARVQRVAAAVLAEHEAALGHAHALRLDALAGGA